ncbi:isochorismatase family protein [Acidicapsa ligni]|uniref:isochorismatase family protein n=1 Tax=Acidicapsa ligni TaxID=542300 RepID=UPI0021E0502E|nr:isochorismatase family protein [Acidicapsa ligni]
MSDLHLVTKKTALVVIDLQKGIVGRPIVPHAAPEILERSSRLARAIREKGGTVVYVRVDFNDFLRLPVDQPPAIPEGPLPAELSEIVPEAGMLPGDALITKRHHGAFARTELESLLKTHGVETVVICGVSTSVGVESTARQGTGLGFAFVVVEDACGAMTVEEHEYAVRTIFPRLSKVRSTDQVIAALA